MDDIVRYGILVAIGASLLLLEIFFDAKDRREDRTVHIGRNLMFGVFGSLIVGSFYVGVLTYAKDLASLMDFGGLMGLTPFPYWLDAILMFLLFDVVLYLWHMSNHKIPFLWRFHQVHHSDADLDFSSAVRFHVGELLISILVKGAFLILTGVPILMIALFDMIVTACALYNHANLSMGKYDRIIRAVIVTPDMHRIHHSRHQKETDSNYTTILSIWDHVFGTYTKKTRHHDGVGLSQFKGKSSRTLLKMITMPFRR